MITYMFIQECEKLHDKILELGNEFEQQVEFP